MEIAVLGAEGWIASLSVKIDSLITPLDGDVFRAIPKHLRSSLLQFIDLQRKKPWRDGRIFDHISVLKFFLLVHSGNLA